MKPIKAKGIEVVVYESKFIRLSDFCNTRSEAELFVKKTAAGALMFNLVLLGGVKDSYLERLYKLFFHLKNLGFARVVLIGNGNKIIEVYCRELNVYYTVLRETSK